MEDNWRFPQRKIIRIKDYDYSTANYYFITICTHEKKCIFGTTEIPSVMGIIAKKKMEELPEHYFGVRVDNYIVMPNHIHAIIVIEKASAEDAKLENIAGAYKAGVSRQIHKQFPGIQVWQRSFYDHVIRNQTDYENIWEYIQFNDQKWKEDRFYNK